MPQHSSTLAWTIYWGRSQKSGCGLSFGTIRISDFDFAVDTVLFAEVTEVFAELLESLTEEAEPLELRVSWVETKVQAFGDILESTIESIPVSGENWQSRRCLPTLVA